MKKIGIAIPTYNRNILLKKLISTLPCDVEKVVSDNGGFVTDEIKSRYNNVIYKTHKSVIDIFSNWNEAVGLISNSEYIAIPSDDDLYIVDSFNKIINEISKNDADIYIFGCQFVDGDDLVIGGYCPKSHEVFDPPYGFNKFIYSVDVRMPSVFFKKDFLDKIGYFDAGLFNLTAADSELIQRALLLGKAVYVPEVVASYRIWPGGLTDQKIATKHWMDEIDGWTNKIRKLAVEKLPEKAKQYNWDIYQDEVFARNLLAGIANLCRAKKYKEAIIHFKAMRFPKNALLKTRLRLIKHVSLAYLKNFYAR